MIDPNEFLPEPKPSPIDQLQNFPSPRYKAGHTLLPNYNGADIIYFSGYQQPGVTDAQCRANSIPLQTILCNDYNYMLSLFWGGGAFNDVSVNLANQNPGWKVSIMTLRSQINSKIWAQNLPSDHYLQDAQGNFLNNDGDITTSTDKKWRATAPLSSYASDGAYVRGILNSALANLTRPINLLCENDEVYPITLPNALRKDPVCNAAINASPFVGNGIFTEGLWFASQIVKNDRAYSDQFMSHPRLTSAYYTEYRLDGNKGFYYNWDQIRLLMDPINGQTYPTGDFYVRWPSNWKDWTSAWHGLKWVTQSRVEELKVNDKLFSPWIGAGWECDLTENVLSAQWLGLLKTLGVYGAEFYYTGYFNEAASTCNGVPNDPKGYAYQMVIPSYAQAVTSRFENELRNGTLLPGDMIDNTNPLGPSPLYRFNTGAENKVVTVRKLNNRYIITGTIQNYDNQQGSTPYESTATFTLNGESITINIRRQGSTYIYDNTNPKIFYQLDGWHESSHPWRWSKDIQAEAENFDSSTGSLKTYLTSFTNFKTVNVLSSNQESVYDIQTRDSAVKYLFIKASGTGNLEVEFNSIKNTVSITTDQWYKIPLNNIPAGSYQLSLKSLSSHEIDQFCITSDANKYPTGNPCTYTYSPWSECIDSIQTRTVTDAQPPGCSGTPVLTQPCIPDPCLAPGNITVVPASTTVTIGWDVSEGIGYVVNITALDGTNTIEKKYSNPAYTGGAFKGLFKNRNYKATVGTICSDGTIVRSQEMLFKTTR